MHSNEEKVSESIYFLPEIFIEGHDVLSPLLFESFNFMNDNIVYPECWAKSMLVPIPKGTTREM